VFACGVEAARADRPGRIDRRNRVGRERRFVAWFAR
jgi:hypothetical protein